MSKAFSVSGLLVSPGNEFFHRKHKIINPGLHTITLDILLIFAWLEQECFHIPSSNRLLTFTTFFTQKSDKAEK